MVEVPRRSPFTRVSAQRWRGCKASLLNGKHEATNEPAQAKQRALAAWAAYHAASEHVTAVEADASLARLEAAGGA